MEKRLKELRNELGLSQAKFAQQIQKSPGYISNVETGRIGLSDYTVDVICTEFGVSKEWLLSGEGSMFVSSEAENDIIETKRKKNDVASRIKLLRKKLNMTQAEFAALVGYSAVQIHFAECGRGVSNEFLHRVANICNVSELWLTDGIGEMNDCVIDERLIQYLRSNPDVVNELMERAGIK